MKCGNCGATTNPGDQVCINCNAKLSLENAIVPEIEKIETNTRKENNKKIVIFFTIGLFISAALIFTVVKYSIIKG